MNNEATKAQREERESFLYTDFGANVFSFVAFFLKSSCKHNIETLISVKCGELLDQLRVSNKSYAAGRAHVSFLIHLKPSNAFDVQVTVHRDKFL